MTVRWKPLLVLSGLFAVIAVVGFGAIAYTLMPRGAADILPSARADRAAGRFDKAKIHYQRALQIDGKNAAIHEEMAAMFGEWAKKAPADRQAELRAWRLSSLAEAAKYGKTLKEPRQILLSAAMAQDEVPESLYWAKDLLALDPADANAHYVIASESLEANAPVLPDVRRHLEALEAAKAPAVRVAWVKARLAQVARDLETARSVTASARTLTLPADADPVDRSALLRLRALDVEQTADVDQLGDRVKSLQAETRALASGDQVAPNRIMRLSLLLERVQKSLTLTASKVDPAKKKGVNLLVDSIEEDVEGIFKRALTTASKSDLHVFLTYAEHLRFRGNRDRCQEVVAEALKSPLASLATSNDVVMGLHAVSVEAALADQKDEKRFEKAAPHIKELLASSSPRFQGLGHLFQGAIELEQAGVAAAPAKEAAEASTPTTLQPKLRSSALSHLQIAANLLPDVVEAQARYGVALVLSQELALGRQYLQNAMRLGDAEPQYQLWAAWSIVQAGYPEEAEPVVNHLQSEMAQGRVSRDLEGTLHLLSGEIHQARRSPEDLKKALVEYERSNAGNTSNPGVQLRMAQIDVQLGQPDSALKRLEFLRAKGQGGTAAEHLAVLILLEQNKTKESAETLAKARAKYPDSDELVGLEAGLLARDQKPKDADRVLGEFLARDPENVSVTLMRAQILSDQLDDPKEARKLLVNVADRADNSAPLVQLALLDLKQKDYDSVSGSIAKIRSRWKEAASADLLDAQLAMEQGRQGDASAFFDAALKKDPGNKLVQFWKAQVDSRVGSPNEAAKAFEAIAKDGSTKQLDSGLSLTEAAKSELAKLSFQSGNLDDAIRRFESLKTANSLGGLARDDRWRLISAYMAKGQWPSARKEIALLLNDAKNPPTDDERVRAANFYRVNDETVPAVAQLDYVLQVNPAHPSAVLTRAYILWEAKKPADALALLRKAIALPAKQKPSASFYLMLAALENVTPPVADSTKRAMTALDQGLTVQPNAVELVQAKYRLLNLVDGPKPALAFVEGRADGDSTGMTKRFLVEVYRQRQDYEAAERTLRDLVAKNPKEPALAAALIKVTALQAARASDLDDRTGERAFNDKTANLIRDFRAKFPTEVSFLQEECELAFRRGDVSRATAVTNEIDQLAPNSSAGPLLRARIYSAQGRTRDIADSYNEALRRNPAQPDVRLLLGQTNLKLGEVDEAIRQARLVQETDKDRIEPILLEARALAQSTGTAEQTSARRTQAVERLNLVIRKAPKVSAAYHQLAEIQLATNQRDAAVKTLRAGVDAVPSDSIGLVQLVELLAAPVSEGKAVDPSSLKAATELATAVDKRDTAGSETLALAVGFHKAEQLDLALTYAEKAVAKQDAPVVHLNFGDILLSLADRDSGDARKAFVRRAVEQYDLVLKTQANSVEAVNNKAWILHAYLGESKKALEVAQGLLVRVDTSTLPGEFFDTLGAIQEALGKTGEAEESYTKGLRKIPDNPVLNLHMGKLMLSDKVRSGKAKGYLEKANAGRNRMSPTMAAEVASLMEKIRGNLRGN